MTQDNIDSTRANNRPKAKLYNRVQMFSGGGYRFGYYLGSYAALCKHQLKPDLILATCGGSLASLLVDIVPDPADLEQLVQSKALYQVVKASRHRQDIAVFKSSKIVEAITSKPNYIYQGLKRLGLSKQLARLAKVHSLETHDDLLKELDRFAMFEIADEAFWLDELIDYKSKMQSSSSRSLTPDIAIIASRIVPAAFQNQIPCEPIAAKLQQVLFVPSNINTLDQTLNLECPTHKFAPTRIVKDIEIVKDWNITQAVRASMADMYYLKPTFINELGWSLGGVIDLTPIELASIFGNTIFAETKSGYDKLLAAPAIQRIFGFDPNERLNEVINYKVKSPNTQSIHWLPLADNGKALSGQHVQKRFNIKQRRIDLVHADYDGFVLQMQAQWNYGYERTIEYLEGRRLL